MVIGIDHGFGLIKTRQTFFKTGLDASDRPPAIGGSDYIEYDGKYYAVSGTRQPLLQTKTQDDSYFLMTLMAIGKETQERGIKDTTFPVTLVVGLPLADFRQQEEEFADYLLRGDGRYKFKFNEIPYDVIVEDVVVMPQGYSAVAANLGTMRHEPVVHIIDIGSWTTDTVTLKEGRPDGASQHSYQAGVIKCIGGIREKIQAEFGRSYSPEQIENVLWSKQAMMPTDVKDAIKNAARDWATQFLGILQEGGFDPTTAPTYFLGGGAQLLANYYQDPYGRDMSHVTYLDDISANAVGYETLLGQTR